MVPVLLSLVAPAMLDFITWSALKAQAQLDHQQQALLDLNRIGSTVARAAVLVIGGKDETDDFKSTMAEVERLQDYSNPEATEEYPELQESINQANMMRESIKRLARVRAEARANPSKETKLAKRVNRQALLVALIEFSDLATKLVEFENSIGRKKPNDSSWLPMSIFTVLIISLCFGVSALIFQLFSNDMLNRLRIITDNARRLATGERLAAPVEGTDEISQLDAIIHTVSDKFSDLRKQELSILDNAADVICSLNDKLKFTAVNPAAIALWKYTPDELLGMSLVSLLAFQSDSEFIHSEFKRIAGSLSETGKFDLKFKLKDGSTRDFQWTVACSKNDQSFSCVVHDVTQLKELERLKQQFMLMVSHDLRSPLTALMINFSMYSDGAKGDVSAQQLAEFERAQVSMKLLLELINDLLELGKLESGRFEIATQRVRAFNICAEAVETLNPMASLTGVKIDRPESDGVMAGDERRLLQAVLNLLSNSIKFAPSGSTIKIEISSLEQFVELRITDSGPGIPLEDRALIFDRFRQSRAESNIAIESSGLGLAIVKAIVTAHGGMLGVDSEVGKGSSFWFRIPKHPDSDEDGDLE